MQRLFALTAWQEVTRTYCVEHADPSGPERIRLLALDGSYLYMESVTVTVGSSTLTVTGSGPAILKDGRAGRMLRNVKLSWDDLPSEVMLEIGHSAITPPQGES